MAREGTTLIHAEARLHVRLPSLRAPCPSCDARLPLLQPLVPRHVAPLPPQLWQQHLPIPLRLARQIRPQQGQTLQMIMTRVPVADTQPAATAVLARHGSRLTAEIQIELSNGVALNERKAAPTRPLAPPPTAVGAKRKRNCDEGDHQSSDDECESEEVDGEDSVPPQKRAPPTRGRGRGGRGSAKGRPLAAGLDSAARNVDNAKLMKTQESMEWENTSAPKETNRLDGAKVRRHFALSETASDIQIDSQASTSKDTADTTDTDEDSAFFSSRAKAARAAGPPPQKKLKSMTSTAKKPAAARKTKASAAAVSEHENPPLPSSRTVPGRSPEASVAKSAAERPPPPLPVDPTPPPPASQPPRPQQQQQCGQPPRQAHVEQQQPLQPQAPPPPFLAQPPQQPPPPTFAAQAPGAQLQRQAHSSGAQLQRQEHVEQQQPLQQAPPPFPAQHQVHMEVGQQQQQLPQPPQPPTTSVPAQTGVQAHRQVHDVQSPLPPVPPISFAPPPAVQPQQQAQSVQHQQQSLPPPPGSSTHAAGGKAQGSKPQQAPPPLPPPPPSTFPTLVLPPVPSTGATPESDFDSESESDETSPKPPKRKGKPGPMPKQHAALFQSGVQAIEQWMSDVSVFTGKTLEYLWNLARIKWKLARNRTTWNIFEEKWSMENERQAGETLRAYHRRRQEDYTAKTGSMSKKEKKAYHQELLKWADALDVELSKLTVEAGDTFKVMNRLGNDLDGMTRAHWNNYRIAVFGFMLCVDKSNTEAAAMNGCFSNTEVARRWLADMGLNVRSLLSDFASLFGVHLMTEAERGDWTRATFTRYFTGKGSNTGPGQKKAREIVQQSFLSWQNMLRGDDATEVAWTKFEDFVLLARKCVRGWPDDVPLPSVKKGKWHADNQRTLMRFMFQAHRYSGGTLEELEDTVLHETPVDRNGNRGEATWTEISMSPKDAKFDMQKILRFEDIPKSALDRMENGDWDGWYDTELWVTKSGKVLLRVRDLLGKLSRKTTKRFPKDMIRPAPKRVVPGFGEDDDVKVKPVKDAKKPGPRPAKVDQQPVDGPNPVGGGGGSRTANTPASPTLSESVLSTDDIIDEVTPRQDDNADVHASPTVEPGEASVTRRGMDNARPQTLAVDRSSIPPGSHLSVTTARHGRDRDQALPVDTGDRQHVKTGKTNITAYVVGIICTPYGRHSVPSPVTQGGSDGEYADRGMEQQFDEDTVAPRYDDRRGVSPAFDADKPRAETGQDVPTWPDARSTAPYESASEAPAPPTLQSHPPRPSSSDAHGAWESQHHALDTAAAAQYAEDEDEWSRAPAEQSQHWSAQSYAAQSSASQPRNGNRGPQAEIVGVPPRFKRGPAPALARQSHAAHTYPAQAGDVHLHDDARLGGSPPSGPPSQVHGLGSQQYAPAAGGWREGSMSSTVLPIASQQQAGLDEHPYETPVDSRHYVGSTHQPYMTPEESQTPAVVHEQQYARSSATTWREGSAPPVPVPIASQQHTGVAKQYVAPSALHARSAVREKQYQRPTTATWREGSAPPAPEPVASQADPGVTEQQYTLPVPVRMASRQHGGAAEQYTALPGSHRRAAGEEQHSARPATAAWREGSAPPAPVPVAAHMGHGVTQQQYTRSAASTWRQDGAQAAVQGPPPPELGPRAPHQYTAQRAPPPAHDEPPRRHGPTQPASGAHVRPQGAQDQRALHSRFHQPGSSIPPRSSAAQALAQHQQHAPAAIQHRRWDAQGGCGTHGRDDGEQHAHGDMHTTAHLPTPHSRHGNTAAAQVSRAPPAQPLAQRGDAGGGVSYTAGQNRRQHEAHGMQPRTQHHSRAYSHTGAAYSRGDSSGGSSLAGALAMPGEAAQDRSRSGSRAVVSPEDSSLAGALTMPSDRRQARQRTSSHPPTQPASTSSWAPSQPSAQPDAVQPATQDDAADALEHGAPYGAYALDAAANQASVPNAEMYNDAELYNDTEMYNDAQMYNDAEMYNGAEMYHNWDVNVAPGEMFVSAPMQYSYAGDGMHVWQGTHASSGVSSAQDGASSYDQDLYTVHEEPGY
ncbi:hypothetical protein AURDEDRAFT_128098 [Auricularia subglabra TFB-10046 SS5]|uniref:Uncharacterized protein n=1 Tax=Auricularia subglabra (strain TFB-10046 / SS5) TaxID=717982 RepID=J0D1P3_AURST|nr:hypothetical protein AURDEDRAFT_128098 [Auricularia subglabra TFB-10046 SS5]